MSASGPIEIACAADRAFLPHTATMLASALANGGGEIRVHLLAGEDIPADDVEELAAMTAAGGATIDVHRMDGERFAGLKAAGPFPTSVWFRTALADVLSDLDRALYLDSDVLVLDSLGPLWETDLGECWLGAVSNVFPDQTLGDAHGAALGIGDAAYFNSGVLLLDLARLRDEAAFDRIREFAIARRTELIFPDQDALNGALAAHRLPLHPRWNLMLGIEQHPWSAEVHGAEAVADAVANPAVRHFEGTTNKPWLPGAHAEQAALWERYRALTPWPEATQRQEAR